MNKCDLDALLLFFIQCLLFFYHDEFLLVLFRPSALDLDANLYVVL